MKTVRNLVVGLVLAVSASFVQATGHWVSGNELADMARSWDNRRAGNTSDGGDMFKAARFQGYVVGVVDSHDSADLGIVCTGPDVSIGQLVAVVSKFVRDNPEYWDKSASDLVLFSLLKTFPCKRGKQQ